MMTRFQAKDAFNLLLVLSGLILIGYIVISSQINAGLPLRFDDGSAGISLTLSQNDYLVNISRFERNEWNGFFDNHTRTSYPAGLSIPAIDLQTNLLGVGLDKNGLIYAPPRDGGHFMASARPNENENIVIVGHSGSGLVFENIFDVQEGTEIILTTIDGLSHTYRVASLLVLPVKDATPEELEANIAYVMPSGQEVLTIISCYPRDEYTHRLVIQAYPQH